MKTIEKKILPKYYAAVCSSRKNFELRKDEDDVQNGDVLVLREWDGEYTGHRVKREVTYVLRDVPEYGLEEGYCIIGFRDDRPSIVCNQFGNNNTQIDYVENMVIK